MAEIEKEKQLNCGEIMNLKEVGIHIGRKDNECIKKWLKYSGVTIHLRGGLTYVYKIDYQCAMMLPHVKDRQRKDPKGWKEYYQKTIKDEALFELIMLELKVTADYRPTSKVKKSKSDQELYKKLLS